MNITATLIAAAALSIIGTAKFTDLTRDESVDTTLITKTPTQTSDSTLFTNAFQTGWYECDWIELRCP